MNKKETIKNLYERGILPSPREFEEALGQGAGDSETKEDGISVKLKKHDKKKRLSAQDFTEYYNNKYEKIKEILLRRMDVVSITNAKTDSSPCGIIGIVKGMTQAGFILEDPTGEIEVIKSDISELEKINPDDVFGIRGFVREGKFFPKEMVWPDIPLSHRIGRMQGTDIILSDNNHPRLIISDGKTRREVQIDETPEWIIISRGQDRVVLVAFKASNTSRDDAILYLKKRSLPEPGPIKPTNPLCLIEEIPDILWLIQGDEWTETHKGITVISCGGGSLARVNLEKRTVEFGKPDSMPLSCSNP